MQDFIKSLTWRGMIQDHTPGLQNYLNQTITQGYIGFDPTAPSLHLGNLAAIMLLKHFQAAGHRPVVLIGGATARIGDPSGKNQERILLSEEKVQENIENITEQLRKFLDFDHPQIGAKMFNNLDWFKGFNYLDFLRQVGKYIGISYLLHKETIQNRLSAGISYTEFSYTLLQAYDFYHLYKNHHVKLQMGGSDQWGNLTTGVEYIRKKNKSTSFALTTPLVTKTDGSKFGKTEKGAVWLDPIRTSPYQMYQFLLNIQDQEAIRYIKIFTLLSQESIQILIKEHQANPTLRVLQKVIAKTIMDMIYHDPEEYNTAVKISDVLFGKAVCKVLNTIAPARMQAIVQTIPHVAITHNQLICNSNIATLLTMTTNHQIFTSKSEVLRLMKDGGLYINKQKITTNDCTISWHQQLIQGQYLLIQKGKKKHYFLIVKS